MIKTDGLSKYYGRGGEIKAVDDLTLKVYERETFGLLGPNGAGACEYWGDQPRYKYARHPIKIQNVTATMNPAFLSMLKETLIMLNSAA